MNTTTEDDVTLILDPHEKVPAGYTVDTEQVRHVIDTIMLIIVLVVLFFLILHFFIRLHYKAKTEYELNELRHMFHNSNKGPSPFAVPRFDPSKKVEEVPPIQYAIQMTPEQFEPVLHHIALGNPPNTREVNKAVKFVAA
ncbi:unnamed protein product [Caenorhabditis bovis]|uniref:Uncharacterized protein n=1 Tax=Caenorhabditis bovis TaxID=2654633 RepID=A0A8S1EMR5_9PELO|nr:unnamed protein product [Caenorhabditis bovis]